MTETPEIRRMENTMTAPLCIYHGNCADGFGAAWSVRYALGENVVTILPAENYKTQIGRVGRGRYG